MDFGCYWTKLRHLKKGDALHRYIEVDAIIHDRLLNWAEWVIDRRRNGHCKSIEWRYLPERIADNEERRKELTRVPVDSQDAAIIERCISGITFPAKQRAVLKCYYINRAPKEICCRKLGIRFNAFGLELGRAASIVRNRLYKT